MLAHAKILAYLASTRSCFAIDVRERCCSGFFSWVTALFAITLLPAADLGLFRPFNQEFCALCQAPLAQAVKLCRLNARPFVVRAEDDSGVS